MKPEPTMRVLSLGAGVQSSVMALMRVLSELESAKAERENLKDREIALLEQAVVEAAQLNELKKEAERMKAVVETVREYFACGACQFLEGFTHKTYA
jgi:Tfp pilus assembly protein PilO